MSQSPIFDRMGNFMKQFIRNNFLSFFSDCLNIFASYRLGFDNQKEMMRATEGYRWCRPSPFNEQDIDAIRYKGWFWV